MAGARRGPNEAGHEGGAGLGSSGARSEHSEAARERLATNPFYVLGLRPDCTRAEVERQGQKLIGMLELELSAALRYRSPLGEHPRSPQLVRAAMAELRDPNRRLLHELWASLDPDAGPDASPDSGPDAPTDEAGPPSELRPFPALAALGFGDWRRR
ncbi:hypothetical protein ENSA5_68790 [Enhygromyxa salina]|uniref:DnaJ domain protein n=1 Tax=Enhygromyxa salina TaxID=215803 RepID=A0A2S9XAZ2_9BACT|nr:hypothetical protein [Enhygromyxa salina]PRP90019.1 hypothetical protein ENSA5_68790 [Enhygromyxa salina]